MFTEVRKRVRRTVFKKGIKPYLTMLIVVLIFSFLDVFYSTGTKEVKILEDHTETDVVQKKDVDAVEKYILSMPVFDGLPEFVKTQGIKNLARFVAKAHPTVLNSLSSNQEYFDNNMDEVVLFLVLGMVVFGVIKFFLTRPLVVGEYRFLMEARFQRDVKIRRMFAPFGNKKFFRVYTTMSRYNLFSILWWLTIVGGIYKYYQWFFVKHILAENPNLKWKQARDLSKAMTDGYKFTIFKIQMSYIYLGLLSYIPLGRICVASPIRTNASIEMYFWLRNRPDIDRSLFIEKAFDEKAYVDRIADGEKPEDIKPEYLMKDFRIKGSSFDENDSYSLGDYTILFFLASIIGWLWEFGLSLIENNAFVKSDSLFGPWLEEYGIFAIIYVAVLSRFKNNKPVFVAANLVLSFLAELLDSFFFVFSNLSSFTDKSIFISAYERFSIGSFVESVVIGFLFVYILAPLIKYALEKLGEKKTKILCRVLILLYVADIIASAIMYYAK